MTLLSTLEAQPHSSIRGEVSDDIDTRKAPDRKQVGITMRFNLPTACLAAVVVIGIPAIASAQGESTERNSNATGSRHVSSGAIGAMRNGAHWITGMNSGSQRGGPNGSRNAAPTAKQGPQGDPSKENDASK